MIFNLFRKSDAPDAALDGYRAIVAQSRQPKFYADWGVPDTVTGRFDMITLHIALLLHRLKGVPEAKSFTQTLVNHFFADMDGSLRELGVTDLGVGPKVKKMGNVVYGMIDVIEDALDNRYRGAVEAILVKNIYGGENPGSASLADYVLAEAARLAATPTTALVEAKGIAA